MLPGESATMAAAVGETDTAGEDFSPSSTVVPFNPPLPLLRGAVPAGPADDLSNGPFVLAFRNAASWRRAFRATESKLIEQCEAGARVGCSISASNKCKPPWWRSLFGPTAADFEERERCEEREMASCLAASRESCIQFAKDKCLPPFRDARIALISSKVVPPVFPSNEDMDFEEEHSSGLSQFDPQVTNYRGHVVMVKKCSVAK